MSTTLEPDTRIHWTPPRQWALMGMIDRGLNDRQIAERLEKHRATVSLARHRFGIRSCSQIHHSGYEVMRLMGLKSHFRVYRWIREGYLRATKEDDSASSPYVIADTDLVTFLEDERYWHLWEPDGVDRRFSEQLKPREGVRFLTTTEAAERLLVHRATVQKWIRHGLLPARRYTSNQFRSLESDLEGFVQPVHKQRVLSRPLRRFTDQEDSIVFDMRDRGETWAAIGTVIDRDPAVVQRRWKLLQERGS